MLEVRNLTKVYRTKGGNEVRALDDVSLSFGETGLVFVLGKSGCGKSTLLNMIGCLDAPTSGEIIADGRSTRNFSARDLDAYRNTFVGFIFQEYNVLNEFSVKDNVSIALELQNEKNLDERVHEILRELELEQYADRKPNTLSGGQKQRVAIARALVKNPRLIMADEPTGALDSNTGKQVLDTLKYLSRTRLVMVVSHDRDFAESYGDRIIELKDGRVISDVTKVHEQAEPLNDAVKRIGPNVLTIKSGARLTPENFAAIQSFISSRRDNVMIATGDEDVVTVRKVVKVTEQDTLDAFIDTAAVLAGSQESGSSPQPADSSAPQRTNEAAPEMQADKAAMQPQTAGEAPAAEGESGFRIAADSDVKTELIRPRLPYRKAFKMGATGLTVKRFRLAITIILSVVAFVFFGLMACFMTYDVMDLFADSFLSSNYSCLNITKSYTYTVTYTEYKDGKKKGSSASIWGIDTYFSEDDVSYLGLSAGDALFGCDVPGTVWNASIPLSSDYYPYYKISINKALYAPEESIYHKTASEGGALLYGTYPTEDNEACISSYMAEALLVSSYYNYTEGRDDDSPEYDVSTIEDIIGTVLYITDRTEASGSFDGATGFEITGIFDAGEMPEEYQKIRDIPGYSSDGTADFTYYLQDGLEKCILVTENYFASMDRDYEDVPDYGFSSASGYEFSVLEDPYSNPDASTSESNFMYYSSSAAETYFFDGREGCTSLADDEAVVPFSYLLYIVSTNFDSAHAGDENYDDEYEDFMYATIGPDGVDIGIYPALSGLYNGSFMYYEPLSNGSVSEGTFYVESDEIIEYLMEVVAEYFTENPACLTLFKGGVSQDTLVAGGLKVVGWYDTTGISGAGVYCSQSLYSKLDITMERIVSCDYEVPEDAYYECMVIPITKTASWLNSVIGRLDGGTVQFTSTNRLYTVVVTVGTLLSTMSLIFMIAGIVLAVFAALLLFNFISVSISNKSKEIGILRAVGASGTDVFKIFFTESAIIALICLVLSLIICAILVPLFDSFFRSSFVTVVSLIVFNGCCVLMMVGIAVIVAVLGTFLPVFFAARRKPAESIRAL
ncbi:MAG: ATP-binding cassette domain-containing protein [Clostridia bacterium]|nr:ATP-binding cassette domain-containing protein [Clostridia bacterium]